MAHAAVITALQHQDVGNGLHPVVGGESHRARRREPRGSASPTSTPLPEVAVLGVQRDTGSLTRCSGAGKSTRAPLTR
jgi:hypothetical protein